MANRVLFRSTRLIASLSILLLAFQPRSAAAQAADAREHVAGENRQIEPAAFSEDPDDSEISRVIGIQPGSGSVIPGENAALGRAFSAFVKRTNSDDAGALEQFLGAYRASRWQLGVRSQLGSFYFDRGYFSQAMSTWEVAWKLGRTETNPATKQIVDRTIGELAKMHARVGNVERLEKLFAEIGDRKVAGSATERLAGAREGLWLMKNRPEDAFRCGPMALGQVLALTAKTSVDPRIDDFKSTPKGTSLWQVFQVSKKLGANQQMARRSRGSKFVVPAVVHWKVGHFAAITESRDGIYRVTDPTFGKDFWVSAQALESEATGYFLVPAGDLPDGWASIGQTEADTVWGKGDTSSSDEDETGECDEKTGCGGSSNAMASYNVHALLVSLNIVDTPLWYQPAIGPAVSFTLTYNQRDAYENADMERYFGPKVTSDWISYIDDNGVSSPGAPRLYRKGGGLRHYALPGSNFGPAHYRDATRLAAPTNATYEKVTPSGWKEVFGFAVNKGWGRRIYRTKLIDPQGNALLFQYDSVGRVIAVVDATGKITRLEYHPTNGKVIRVEDPFGRAAKLDYSGTLTTITDMGGIESKLRYSTTYTDFVESLTTPYGTTRFAYADSSIDTNLHYRTRWLEATDPHGAKERVEFTETPNGIPYSDPAETLPQGIYVRNTVLTARNTFYWSKKAMAEAPGDYTQARIIHWLHSANYVSAIGVAESRKEPLENRIWLNYFGQPANDEGATVPGIHSVPSKVARRLDDGTTQLTQLEHNSLQNVTKVIDPKGRETVFEYATNGTDLIRIKQKGPGGIYQMLVEYGGYNTQHLPATKTDAAGQVITYTYTPYGQVRTAKRVRNGVDEITTYEYGTNRVANDFARLKRITYPMPGATRDFTYDAVGRLATATESDGYTVTYEYDNLNRLTKVIYPDGTYEQAIYNRLEAEWIRDRQGRWSNRMFDSLHRLVADVDPEGRWTQYEWCDCGSLEAIVDGNGNRTSFLYDVQGRLTDRQYAIGNGLQYEYENTTSRLKHVLDGKGQRTNYTYNLDDTINTISYTNASGAPLSPPTPTVSYQYDNFYERVTTMTDGTGQTTYEYWPVQSGTPGAGNLRWVDGPLTDNIDKVEYGYDFDRKVHVQHGGYVENILLDALGRVDSVENTALGNFDYSYVGQTSRLASVLNPNGSYTSFSYHPNTASPGAGNGDFRLATIHNRQREDGLTVSKHDYSYNVTGTIAGWTQQTGLAATPLTYAFGYDAADQLKFATRALVSSPSTPEKQFTYRYDQAGNRVLEQINTTIYGATFNALNQIQVRDGTGMMEFEGTVNELANVTVGGNPAPVDGNLRFKGKASVTAGQQSVEIKATDLNGNITTKYAPVNVTAGAINQSFQYDDNGNTIGDEARDFTWDAENRLKSVTIGTSVYSWEYNGDDQRVLEKLNGTVVKRWVWDGTRIIAELNAAGDAVNKYHYYEGHFDAAAPYSYQGENTYYYTRDHLGSIREVVDGGKAVRVHYDYDPYGRRTDVGAMAVQVPNAAGAHQHFFYNATQTLTVGAGDRLVAYVYVDPANPPSEVMLQWHDASGSWEHRAFWGADLIPWGAPGGPGRFQSGALPAPGHWVRLEVAAADVGLEGVTVTGMAFTLFNGSAKFDHAGKTSTSGGLVAQETVWVDEQLPTGAIPDSPWTWVKAGFQSEFGYTGHYYHAPSNLHLAYYRAYDADVGRWLSRDPIEEEGGLNLYGYTHNNSPNWIDPDGLQVIAPPGGPPPVPPPGGGTWVSEPGTSGNQKREVWRPNPKPKMNCPSASWDPEGHWDVDDGKGNRSRYDWRGNPISADKAHNPKKPAAPRNRPRGGGRAGTAAAMAIATIEMLQDAKAAECETSGQSEFPVNIAPKKKDPAPPVKVFPPRFKPFTPSIR